jgi:hypothetical protein
MDVLHERVAGLDVHQATIVACVRPMDGAKGEAAMPQLRDDDGRPVGSAGAAALLTAIYHMLKDGTAHHDLGADHFERRPPQVRVKQLVARLAQFGYQVQLQPLHQAA